MNDFFIDKSQWITFVAGLITAIVSAIAFNSSEKSGITKRTLAKLTFIGGILTALGGILSNEDSTRKNNNINIKSDSIKVLSLSNSSKLDSSLGRLETIIGKSESQIKKLTLVEQEITDNYDKIDKGYNNLVNKTKSLKYIINDSFKLYLRLEFQNKNFISYFKNKSIIYKNNSGQELIDCNYIGRCINDWSISINISKNKVETKSDSNSYSTIYSNSLTLINMYSNELPNIYSYNFDKYCIITAQIIDGVDLQFTIPLKIQHIYEFQTLDDLKNSDIEITFGFNNFSKTPDYNLSQLLKSNFKINTFSLSHKYDMIIGSTSFKELNRNNYSVKIKLNKIWYRNLK